MGGPEDRSSYEAVALHLPNEVRIGGALITLVEPNPGHERAYNRWYEDDHFYSGAMHGPWTFAGRRWVAPRALRERRVRVERPLGRPPEAGCYISLYWVTAGHELDNQRWSLQIFESCTAAVFIELLMSANSPESCVASTRLAARRTGAPEISASFCVHNGA